jgi:hypothetical protein
VTGCEGAIARVRDQRGYDCGFAARCTTHDWTSPELRETPSAAMPDLLEHITTRPTEPE